MTFTRPFVLILTLLAVVGLVFLLRALNRRRSAETLAYSDLAFLEAATATRVPWPAILAGVWVCAAACLGVALAGPHVVAQVSVRDAAVALCIDTSGSMSAADVAPTRADAALRAARTFIENVPNGTRISLVAFSSSAAVILPATDDKDAAREALERIPPPNGGTAIGDALAVAARSMPPVRHRTIALVLAPAAAPHRPLLVWNASASAPVGVYAIGPAERLSTSDMVIARVPSAVQMLAAQRHYIPANVPLVKRIAAGHGDTVCALGRAIWINGIRVADRLQSDGAGRAMPGWRGCVCLGRDAVFLLMADHRASFDGRYFGPTSRREIIGKATLLWAR